MANNFNHWSAIADQLSKETSQVVSDTARAIRDGYQSRVKRDTGFSADSAYVVSSQENTYGQASPTTKGSYLLPCVETPSDDQTAYAAVAANYAEYPEFGTRFMPAQPAFIPSVDAAQPLFEDAIAAIESKLQP